MPVVDFYMKGVTNDEMSRLSFVCTCTLKEDMDRVSNELNLNLDTDTWRAWTRESLEGFEGSLSVPGVPFLGSKLKSSKSRVSSPVGIRGQ